MAIESGQILRYTLPLIFLWIILGSPLPAFLKTNNSSIPAKPIAISESNLQWAENTLIFPAQANELPGCYAPPSKTYIYSREPLVLYIENFLSAREIEHLIALSEPHFQSSTVFSSESGATERIESLDTSIRKSEKAALSRNDTTVLCIERRARQLQGWRPDVFVEQLWAQRYTPGGFYNHHYDWGTASSQGGRVSSFMVWLDGECVGGGTEFPRLRRAGGLEWCNFIECDGGGGDEMIGAGGTTFKPVTGNAVYWENMGRDGKGYEESWHAGLPVEKGAKIGLNIWNWWQPGLGDALEERRNGKRAEF